MAKTIMQKADDILAGMISEGKVTPTISEKNSTILDEEPLPEVPDDVAKIFIDFAAQVLPETKKDPGLEKITHPLQDKTGKVSYDTMVEPKPGAKLTKKGEYQYRDSLKRWNQRELAKASGEKSKAMDKYKKRILKNKKYKEKKGDLPQKTNVTAENRFRKVNEALTMLAAVLDSLVAENSPLADKVKDLMERYEDKAIKLRVGLKPSAITKYKKIRNKGKTRKPYELHDKVRAKKDAMDTSREVNKLLDRKPVKESSDALVEKLGKVLSKFKKTTVMNYGKHKIGDTEVKLSPVQRKNLPKKERVKLAQHRSRYAARTRSRKIISKYDDPTEKNKPSEKEIEYANRQLKRRVSSQVSRGVSPKATRNAHLDYKQRQMGEATTAGSIGVNMAGSSNKVYYSDAPPMGKDLQKVAPVDKALRKVKEKTKKALKKKKGKQVKKESFERFLDRILNEKLGPELKKFAKKGDITTMQYTPGRTTRSGYSPGGYIPRNKPGTRVDVPQSEKRKLSPKSKYKLKQHSLRLKRRSGVIEPGINNPGKDSLSNDIRRRLVRQDLAKHRKYARHMEKLRKRRESLKS